MNRLILTTCAVTLAVASAISASSASAAPWAPPVGTAWQWQLSGKLDQTVNAPVFDLDGFDTTAAQVAALHAKGRHVICYLDMGGAENYRPDYKLFPPSTLGKTVGGWPDERWVDVRQIALLQPLVTSRFNMCQAKGFDAVEPDLADGYANATGFPITQADQIAWNDHLAAEAHDRGMSIALKNAPELVVREVPAFDFAIVEECLQYGECSSYQPFIAAGKAVLHTEYKGVFPGKICGQPSAAGFSTMKKKLSLNGFRQACL